MEFLPLNIFPEGGLASSVVTTVWIGIIVVGFFNLRFGWVLSGLVVPGYIVPLLMIKPWSAGVILIEAIVTYLFVWLLSEKCSRFGLWSSIFGRDRFFALVLVSIFVRVSFDGWLWPLIGEWVTTTFSIEFDYRNTLHSFGLVIIALIANQFWKTGVVRGLIPLLVTVFTTFLIVRYGLLELTNFTISTVGYMYEEVAASILASPKSYIILVTAALVASRMNLLYGWDFSGILIPSLLALQWYQPEKIFVTFVEAFFILFTASWLLRTPLFKNSNIEGARKLLFFFNISFLYKLFLGYLILYFFPDHKVSDTYAFGYLLATLMAIKMYEKDIAVRMTRATLQTSLVSALLASVVGFAFTLLPAPLPYETSQAMLGADISGAEEKRLESRVAENRITFYGADRPYVSIPTIQEVEIFRTSMQFLKNYLETQEKRNLVNALDYLARVDLSLEMIEQRYLYISESGQSRGWGSYVLDTLSPEGLVIEIPAPLDERNSLEAGLELFKSLDASALAIAGSRRTENVDLSSDALRNPQLLFHHFHRIFADNNVLQVRARQEDDSLLDQGDQERMHGNSDYLWVKKSIPENLDLVTLRENLGELEVIWGDSQTINRQRESTREGFLELFLTDESLRQIRALSLQTQQHVTVETKEQRIDGYLLEWILSQKAFIAEKGSDLYHPPNLNELLYFDEEVVTPLLQLAQGGVQENSGELFYTRLNTVRMACSVLGYNLMQYRQRQTGNNYLVLYEADSKENKLFWGTYVFRLGPSDPFVVQVPRPLYEVNSFEYAVSLFERLNARALLIAGTHPYANRDGGSNLVLYENYKSLFSMVNQAILREFGDQPMMVVHSRARGVRPGMASVAEDALLSSTQAREELATDPLVQRVVSTFEEDGISYRFVDGSAETAGYEVAGVPQSLYLKATRNKQFLAVWLSPLARRIFQQQSGNKQENSRFRALAIENLDVDLYHFIKQYQGQRPSLTLPAGLVRDVNAYLASQDIVALRRIQFNWPEYHLQRLIDRDSRQSFLAVADKESLPLAIVNLNPRNIEPAMIWYDQEDDFRVLSEFINTRAAWLFMGGAE